MIGNHAMMWFMTAGLEESLTVGLNHFLSKYKITPCKIEVHTKHNIKEFRGIPVILSDTCGQSIAFFYVTKEEYERIAS